MLSHCPVERRGREVSKPPWLSLTNSIIKRMLNKIIIKTPTRNHPGVEVFFGKENAERKTRQNKPLPHTIGQDA